MLLKSVLTDFSNRSSHIRHYPLITYLSCRHLREVTAKEYALGFIGLNQAKNRKVRAAYCSAVNYILSFSLTELVSCGLPGPAFLRRLS